MLVEVRLYVSWTGRDGFVTGMGAGGIWVVTRAVARWNAAGESIWMGLRFGTPRGVGLLM